MKIAITGATGNLGKSVLKELLKLDFVETINILGHNKKRTEDLIKKNKKYKKKIHVVMGSLDDIESCRSLIKDMDIVINSAGVIPPLSDSKPNIAVKTNEIGVKTLVSAIEEENKTKLIHISTIDVYGYRNEKHPSGRIEDPLIPSVYDIYGITKMRGEYAVLESNINSYVVLRQTAMLYDDILMKNISSEIMFQTAFNSPLEWITDKETGTLFKNIIIKEHNMELNYDNFWNKCFNVGGCRENKNTYYESIDIGFKIIGGNVPDFFNTNYDSLRNSHGIWLTDSDKLEDLFHYKSITYSEFWDKVKRKYWYFSIAKILPKKWIKKRFIDKLLDKKHSPSNWVKVNDDARITAFFGSKENYYNIDNDWNNFNLSCKSEGYENSKNNPNLINYYYDVDKDIKDITIDDLRNVATAHGGRLISNEYNNPYQKLEWETQDKEIFMAKPYTILKCGHWYNTSYKVYAWDFDRLSKKDKIYASIWLDSHDKSENNYYYFDDNFNAMIKTNN